MPGIAGEAELEETLSDRARRQGGDVDEDDIARNPRVARRPAAPTKAMIWHTKFITPITASGAPTAWPARESVISIARRTER